MPIYEFYCPDNHTVYQFLARSLALGDKTPRCPVNPAAMPPMRWPARSVTRTPRKGWVNWPRPVAVSEAADCWHWLTARC